MDPAAQTNPLDNPDGQDLDTKSPIQAGQFVIAEQGQANSQAISNSPAAPNIAPSPVLPTQVNPPIAPSPSVAPNQAEELLQNIAQETGGQAPEFTPPQQQDNLQIKNEPIPTYPELTNPNPPFAPELPTLGSKLAGDLPAEPQVPQQSTPSVGPDPTPFSSPETMADIPPAPSSSGGKLRSLLLVVGVFALIGIIGASLWFFVLNKSPKEDIKTESLASEIEEDLPPIPKRTVNGFGDIEQPNQFESSSEAILLEQEVQGLNLPQDSIASPQP